MWPESPKPARPRLGPQNSSAPKVLIPVPTSSSSPALKHQLAIDEDTKPPGSTPAVRNPTTSQPEQSFPGSFSSTRRRPSADQ